MQTSASIKITGYVGRDPISPSVNHPNFVTFSVSVSGQDKDKTPITTWYQCQTSNEKIAQKIRSEITKGTPVTIVGIPTFSAYMDKNGNPASSCKIYIAHTKNINVLVAEDDKSESIKSNKNDIYEDFDDSIPF